MALQVTQLVRNTPSPVVLRARACAIRPRMKGRVASYKGLGQVYEAIYAVRCTDGPRIVTIRFIAAKKPGLKQDEQMLPQPSTSSPVWVSCTCPYHLYWVEYALAKHGSSDIIFGNGQPPRVRNPRMIPYLCKHSLLAIRTALKAWKKQEVADRRPETAVPISPSKIRPDTQLSQEPAGQEVEPEEASLVVGPDTEPTQASYRIAQSLRDIALHEADDCDCQ